MTDPSPIKATLERFLSQMGAPPVRTLIDLRDRWVDVVGPGLDGPTRPIELIDGVLVIGCDDATWASQITWMDAQIKRRFAEAFDGQVVRRITTRIQS